MNCAEFERGLEDLDDYSTRPPLLEEHLRSCLPCSHLLDDLTQIQQGARHLQLAAEPDDRVWQRLRAKLDESGLIAEPVSRRFFRPAAVPGWFARLSMSMAYAAVFFIALGVVYLY